MPSITQWSALAGLGKAGGESLKDLLANRFAEQKRQDLLAEAELRRQEALAQQEETRRHYRATETTAERNAASLEGQRTDAAAKYRSDAERANAEAADKAAALAELNSMTPEQWESLPQYRRYGLYNRAYGGGSPPAGALETPKEREARIKGERQFITESQIAVENAREGNRDPKEDPLSTRQVPPAAGRLITQILNKYKDPKLAEQNFYHHLQQGHFEALGPEVDPLKVEEAFLRALRLRQLAKLPQRDPYWWEGGGGGGKAPQQAPVKLKPIPKPIEVNGFTVEPIDGR